MHLNLTKEDLLPAVQAAESVTATRGPSPILAHCYLQAEESGLALTGTDLEVEMQTSASAEVAEPGEATVPARKLRDIVQSLPPETELTLRQDDAYLHLKAGRSRFRLAGLNPDDFPGIAIAEDASAFAVPQSALKTLLDRTAFAMGRDDPRYYLNGTLLEWHGTQLRAVATDGHRLALTDQAVGEWVDRVSVRDLFARYAALAGVEGAHLHELRAKALTEQVTDL